MNLDLEKLKEIYGDSIINEISTNVGNLINNINYLKSRQFTNAEEIFERYPYAFLTNEEEFKSKVDKLITSLGVEYIEKLEEDMNLWSILENE